MWSGASTPTTTWSQSDSGLLPLTTEFYNPSTLQHIIVRREFQRRRERVTERRARAGMLQEDIRSRSAQTAYYRQLDQQRNRGEITQEQYDRLRGSKKKAKKKATLKTKLSVTTRKPPPPPPSSGRFSAMSIR